jgi:hypothetical protein
MTVCGGDAAASLVHPATTSPAALYRMVMLIGAVLDVRWAGRFVRTALIDAVTPSGVTAWLAAAGMIAES